MHGCNKTDRHGEQNELGHTGCWEMQLTGLEKHAAHSINGQNPPSPLPGPASVIISIREFSPNTAHKTQN